MNETPEVRVPNGFDSVPSQHRDGKRRPSAAVASGTGIGAGILPFCCSYGAGEIEILLRCCDESEDSQ